MILQLLSASVFSRSNKVPHEAFDFVVSAIMNQAVGQQGPADGLHVPLCQLLLKTPMVENILPTTPAGQQKGKFNFVKCLFIQGLNQETICELFRKKCAHSIELSILLI